MICFVGSHFLHSWRWHRHQTPNNTEGHSSQDCYLTEVWRIYCYYSERSARWL